jgi:hypothetical protein
MKKILISLFSLILIAGLTINANACETCGCQKDAKKECTGNLETSSDNTTKACEKSKKECCKSKKNSSCTKSGKKTTCSKSSKNGFDFTKSNNYGGEKSKKCCKTKTACSKSKKDNQTQS